MKETANNSQNVKMTHLFPQFLSLLPRISIWRFLLLLGTMTLLYFLNHLLLQIILPFVANQTSEPVALLEKACQIKTIEEKSVYIHQAIKWAPLEEELTFRLVLSTTFIVWTVRLKEAGFDGRNFLRFFGLFLVLGITYIYAEDAFRSSGWSMAIAHVIPAVLLMSQLLAGWLRRRPLPLGWTASFGVLIACAFAYMHLNNYSACHLPSVPVILLLVVPQLLGGIVLTWAAWAHGLRTSWLAHMYYNTVSVTLS